MFASLALLLMAAPPPAPPVTFAVTYSEKVRPGPVSARVYVMLDEARPFAQPRASLDWFQAKPVFAREAKDWKPGEPLIFDAEATGYPTALGDLPKGRYAAQAVVRLNPEEHDPGKGVGNAFGPVITFEVDPSAPKRVELKIDQIIPKERFRETERIKLVEAPSALLTKFHGHEVMHRAAVVLPKPLDQITEKLPTIYIIPGFGGDHTMAPAFAGRMDAYNFGNDFIKVILDPDCGTGHHVFADSPRNGPRGQALVEEFVPLLEGKFPMKAEPRYRLLNGHSSGGWSSLWLAITYPETFSATWSTSPDPVDFRDFCGVDVYAAGANIFRDPAGNRRPIARQGEQPILWTDNFSKQEDVVGDGGQLHSFEAVFSPLGPDGRERPLFDRTTGAVIPEVAEAWKQYDIRLILEQKWPELGPKLAGRIHVYMGGTDTFYLEGATKMLKESLVKLKSDAVIEIIPGRDHFTVLDGELSRRIDREMHAWINAAP